MAGYKLSAAILNRRRTPGKVTDGLALSFIRNKDGSLTAWQRVGGKDVRVESIVGEITQDRLVEIRAKAYAIKSAGGADAPGAITFSQAWERHLKQMEESKNARWGDSTLIQYKARMLKHVAPTAMWCMPIAEITSPVIREVIAPLRSSQPKLAPKVLDLIGQVLAATIGPEGITTNHARLLKSELRSIEKKIPFDRLPAVTDLESLGKLLNTIENSSLYVTTRAALLLQAFTAQRSGEVAAAEWREFTFMEDGRAIWRIPRRRMKVSEPSKMPYDQVLTLPKRVADVIKSLHKTTDYVFTPRHGDSEHITVEAFSQAFARLGFRGIAVPHGWRSSLKTLAEAAEDDDGRPMFSSIWVEGVLDHSPKGVSTHYHRGKAEQGMARVLAWWATVLDDAATAYRDKCFRPAA